jgi:hypothetical protein
VNNDNPLKRFQLIWGKLESKYNYKSNHKCNRSYLNLLDSLIRDWCEELDYGDQSEEIIKNWQYFQKNNTIIEITYKSYLNLLVTNQSIGRMIEDALESVVKLLPNPNKIEEQQKFRYNIRQTIKKENSDMNIKFLALLAFVLTGIGIAIYLLNKNQPDREQGNLSNKKENHKDVKPNQRQGETKRKRRTSKVILFLAVEVEYNEGIIDDLKRSKKMTQEAVEALSRTVTIQALWQGNEDEFNSMEINKYFEYDSSKEQNKYDVYLIKIELDEPEPEFERDIPKTSRGRGFKRLLTKYNKVVEVSERLPKQSINNPNLYR